MKKGTILEGIEVTGISSDGRAVGKYNGEVIFIKNAVPGDVVDVSITGRDKKFKLGKVHEYQRYSDERVEPVCKHFGICGGCKWQNLDYNAQLRHKQDHVIHNLRKISGMQLPESRPIMGVDETYFYRNKLEFTFSNNRWLTREEIDSGETFDGNALGFHIPRMFDKILDIQECHLQADPSNEIRNGLRAFAKKENLTFYDIRNHIGLLRNVIIRNTTLGEVMVIVQFGEDDIEGIRLVMDYLKSEFSNITSLNYIVNQKKNDSFYDQDVINYHSLPYITEKMGSLHYRIGPKSFYQTNSRQAEKLYEQVKNLADIQPEDIVYDLYTGTGTIANYIADLAKKVVGIESVPDAVEDAKINAELNGITNTSFYAGDMKDMLTNEFIEKNGKPRVVITDPPRAGMHKNVIEGLINILPEKIVYVSCNPATQARDLELLKEYYKVDVVQPVDMFPHTQHVENIVRLVLIP